MISKKYGAFWLSQSTGISSDIPPPKHLFGSDFSIKSCAVGIKKGICLAEDGKVYEKGLTKEEIKDPPAEIFIQTAIKAIACNDMVGIMISNQGEVFIWGVDSKQSGLFIEPGLYSSEIPVKIPQLEEIIQGSIGKTHAAVIDSMGHLFTWGSGSQGELGTLGFSINHQPPMIVESAKIFKAKQVLCGPSFTCICTDGCYVYLYGVIGSAHNYINSRRSSIVRRLPTGSPKKGSGNYPYTLPELEKYSITAVSCGNSFIVALTDSGEAYIFDDCMDLVKLPINYGDSITSIASTLDFAYGFSRSSSCIYEWREKFQNRLSSSTDFMECQLTYWIGKVYAVHNEHNNLISLVSTCSHMAGLLYEAEEPGTHQIARYLTELAPYKRSEYANKLIGSVFDSLDYNMEKNSSLRSSLRGSIDLTITKGHEDLERLYPKGDNDKTIERIIQCRIEHDRKERLSKSIFPLVYPVLKSCFSQIKEFAGIKCIYDKTLAAALIPGIIGNLYHRFKIESEAFAFQAIKRFSNYQKFNENNEYPIYDPRKKEAARGILQEISALAHKYKLLAFTLIKEREILCLQKKTAALTLKQAIKDMNKKALKRKFERWLKVDANERSDGQKSIEKILKKCIILYERAHFKQALKIWINSSDPEKINKWKQDYQRKMSSKIIFTRISSHIKRLKKKIFNRINNYSLGANEEESPIINPSELNFKGVFQKLKSDRELIMEEKLQILEDCLQKHYLNVLSDSWSNLIDDGKLRTYSIMNLSNTNDETSNNTPEALKQDDDMVLMHSIESMPKSHSTVSVNVNQLSVFPDLHTRLSERDQEKLDFVSPSDSDGFILDLPGEKRSQPVELEESEISRLSSTTFTRHTPTINQIYKAPEVEIDIEAEISNNSSRSNLYANHSSQQSFDSSSYQQKLIQNMISSPKIYKEKDKDKALKIALNSGRPPWKPSSKSPAIAPVHKAIVSPTNKRQQYDTELKQRMRFIVKKKSGFITPNFERLNGFSPQNLLEFTDSVPTDSAPTESDPSPCRDVKNCVFDPNMSFETKPEEDKRVKLSYQKLIKYRKGISALEKAVSKSLSNAISESLAKIKLKSPSKVGNKGRETNSKARDIPWQHRLYLVASDNLLRVMRKIYKKVFVAKLKRYR
ncbi:unnamed protein product [Blepharisma stoltei]|uniref:Uncharacterized protein n=1 Tax=Blepharisma stoltei TaxID=1481888 RepID=A0AAU9JZC5_9CILI|nr:unnamed protein product [Blepharisma stoltei]